MPIRAFGFRPRRLRPRGGGKSASAVAQRPQYTPWSDARSQRAPQPSQTFNCMQMCFITSPGTRRAAAISLIVTLAGHRLSSQTIWWHSAAHPEWLRSRHFLGLAMHQKNLSHFGNRQLASPILGKQFRVYSPAENAKQYLFFHTSSRKISIDSTGV